jgi:hypothetical protein
VGGPARGGWYQVREGRWGRRYYWSRGYFVPHVDGLGAPGMLFVLSCKACQRLTWFMLNQATLDRGPDVKQCDAADNCWSSSSAGELDFLETAFWEPAFYNQSMPDGAPNPNRNNSRMYATAYNGAGRCFPVNKGPRSPTGSYIPSKAAGGECSANYFQDDGRPHVYAAVVDRRGMTVYRDPDWAGLGAFQAAPVLTQARPAKPLDLSPPCDGMVRRPLRPFRRPF